MIDIDNAALDTDIKDLERALKRVERELSDMRPLYRAVGQKLLAEFQGNMTKGVDPNGTPLAQPARWTRIAGASAGKTKARLTGKMVPLLNTGRLRAAMGVIKVQQDGMEMGFVGAALKKASKMIHGTPGKMRLRAQPVKKHYSGIRSDRKDGHKYIRVRSGSGWITRQVTGGTVTVRPLKRNFFFLSSGQIKEVLEMIDKGVDKRIEKAMR